MATSLVTFQSFGITASSTPSSGSSPTKKASSQGRKSSQSSTGWLTPIFGWSADQPDYIDSSNNGRGSRSGGRDAESGEERKARLRYAPGSFTEEKAKQLRMMTTGLEMSHEKMYHSAIASRLASDFSDRFFDDLT
uniref:Uncharacterized protein n=1 Tax=Kalanchoe fedtschenkoi TaxID=63787 RepID=A0A7N0TF29_KALFE